MKEMMAMAMTVMLVPAFCSAGAVAFVSMSRTTIRAPLPQLLMVLAPDAAATNAMTATSATTATAAADAPLLLLLLLLLTLLLLLVLALLLLLLEASENRGLS